LTILTLFHDALRLEGVSGLVTNLKQPEHGEACLHAKTTSDCDMAFFDDFGRPKT
jgi:hypothetical protein